MKHPVFVGLGLAAVVLVVMLVIRNYRQSDSDFMSEEFGPGRADPIEATTGD